MKRKLLIIACALSLPSLAYAASCCGMTICCELPCC